jgi:cobalamin biosynthesis protein CobD/CbiB
MDRAMTKGRIAETSPRFQGGIAFVYYLLTIVTAIVVLFLGSRLNFLVDVIATAFYVAATALFHALTKRG